MQGGGALAADPQEGSGPHSLLRRSGRARRTTRVRDDFFDTSLLQYVAPPDEPHAFLEEEEGAGSTKKAASAPKAPSPKGNGSSIAYELPDNRPVGPDHQVTAMPAWRPRPAQPTPSEAAFLQAQPLYPPHQQDTGSASAAAHTAAAAAAAASFKAAYQAAPDADARRSLLDAAVRELDARLGADMVKVLHLESLGSKLRASWQPHEELLFCLGMCDKYRFFKYIRQCYLCRRSAHELNGYYHNVWKTRSTREADVFLTMREQRADAAAMQAFVDGIRGRLTSMWDRKRMGDMPKLLKDAAAAAEADAQLQAAAAAAAADSEEPPSTSGHTAASPSGSSAAAAAAVASSDGSDGAAPKPAAAKPRQRKRPAPGPAAGSSQKRAQPQQQGAQDAALPAQQPQAVAVKDEGLQQGGTKRRRRGQQQQQGRAAAAAVAAAAELPAGLKYPDMPTYPDVDLGSASAVASWLSHVPAYRSLMAEYMEVVNSITDAAVAAHQLRIQQVKQQRDRLQADADAYIRGLLAQGQQVLQSVQAHAAAKQQAAAASQPQQHDQQQQQPEQEQQQASPLPSQQRAAPTGSGDLQSAVRNLLLGHTKTAAGKQQQQQQQPAAGTGLPSHADPAPKQQSVQDCAGVQLSPQVADAGSGQQQEPAAADAAHLAAGDAGCGGSSSEDCEMFLACTEADAC